MKSFAIRAAKWGLAALALVIVLAGGIFTVLQTPWGKDRLIEVVQSASRVDGVPAVYIEGLTGLLPFDFAVGAIELRDREGPWLRIEALDFRLGRVWPLFAGRLEVEHCRARELRILRAVVSEPEPAPKEPGDPLKAVEDLLSRLAVGELRIDRLSLQEAVMGEPAVFALNGAFGEAGADRGRGIRILFERVDDGPATRLEGEAFAWPDTDRLRVAFLFHEDPGGLLGKMASIPDGIEIQMDGDGEMDAWKGRLSAAVGAWGSAAFLLGLEIGDAARLSLEGVLQPGDGVLPVEWAGWCLKAPEIAAAVRIDGFDRAAIDHLRIDTGAVHLEGAGSFDLEKRRMEAGFDLLAPDLSPLDALTGGGPKGRLTLSGAIEGPFDRLTARFRPVLESFRMAELGVGRFAGDLEAELIPAAEGASYGLRLAGEGAIEAVTVAGERPLGDSPLGWKILLSGPTAAGWGIETFELAAEGQRLKLSGSFDPEGVRGEARVVLSSRDLGPLSAPWGLALPGRADLQLRISADGPEDVDAVLEGTLSVPTADLPPGIPPALGGRWAVAGVCRLDAGRHLTFENVRFEGERETVSASGTLDLASRRVDITAGLRSDDIAAVGRGLDLPLSGALAASAVMTGTLDVPEISLETAGSEFTAWGLSFPDLRLEGSLKGPLAAATGEARLSFTKETGLYAVAGAYAFGAERITADGIRVSAPGFAAEGRFHIAGGSIGGDLAGKAQDFMFLTPFVGEEPAGVSGSADFRFVLDPSPEGGTLTGEIAGEGIHGSFGTIDAFQASGRVLRPLGQPAGEARLELKGFRQAGFDVASLTLDLMADSSGSLFEGRIEGAYGEPLAIELGGALGYGAGPLWMRIERLNGRYGAYPVLLVRPLTVEREGASLTVDDLALRFGSGLLQATVHLDAERLEGKGALIEWPLESLPPFQSANLRGTAEVDAVLDGSLERPIFEADFNVKDLRSADPDFSGMPSVQIAGYARSAEGGISAAAGMRTQDREVLTVEALAPYAVSFSPAGARRIDGREWSGRVEADIDLAMFNGLVDWEDQVLSGVLTADMRLGGAGENPLLAGGMKVVDGAYENLRTGTVLKDLSLEAACGAERIDITSAQASDGGEGRLSAAGWVALDPEGGFPLQVDLTLANATLVRRIDATVATDGVVRLTGALRDMLLAGRVVVGPADLRIPESLPPEVVTLDVVEINGVQDGPAVPEKKESTTESPGLRLRFDLAVSSPGRVFVRGRGLDSEWEGNLTIKGSADAPVLAGRLSLVRGRFDFLGKPFQLTRGVITFDGSVPPDPSVDVVAEASTGDVTARVSLAGTPSTLKLALSSDPPLPPDEILSYILFRRTASRLNAAQALQLAAAVRTLAGGGGGLDFMSRTRRLLDVDQLQIRTPENGQGDTTLAAGKYINEKVYLEVERGLGPESGRISVDVEITPSITWEADVGENSEGGIGIKWRRDY
ncbi:translocation/assembly module TamB domain-containing protein [Desulfatiglans anilini]|uniref:translocation/assembly module TamB domain-containing protein n=1 Tax=Desulfatiglans anilini TaxID=90728 RepID=UPI000408C1DA|nr:translocation/assembly module TamB domain-containing protein [Desulfatiglans anilini]